MNKDRRGPTPVLSEPAVLSGSLRGFLRGPGAASSNGATSVPTRAPAVGSLGAASREVHDALTSSTAPRRTGAVRGDARVETSARAVTPPVAVLPASPGAAGSFDTSAAQQSSGGSTSAQ